MDLTQPALAVTGSPGRLSWTAPTMTEHMLMSVFATLGPRILALQGIGFTCPNPPNCPAVR
jgi:hypothetical protein